MVKKPSWDDIPSLNLELDDKSDAEETRRRGGKVRMLARDVLSILKGNARVILVQVATSKGVLPKKGILHDIHQNGMCFIMPAHGLQKDDTIRIGTMLGEHAFQTNAIVRWATEEKVGIEYVNPQQEDVVFLSELYSAKMLKKY
jgi:hypothetical protein